MNAVELEKIAAAYREYRTALLSFLKSRVGKAEDAEELLQEVYLRLCRIPDLDTIDNLPGLLFSTALNLVTDFYRREHSQKRSHLREVDLNDAYPAELYSTEPSQERHLLGREWIRQLERVLTAMPKKRQQVFLLHKIHGYSYPEIAEKLNISKKTVEKHMSQALGQCRKRLDPLLNSEATQ